MNRINNGKMDISKLISGGFSHIKLAEEDKRGMSQHHSIRK